MIYFVADTHFYHKNIIGYCSRPFADADSMNEALVQNWNAVVGKDDIVYHLGDVIVGDKSKLEEIMQRLNGHKILVRGNHDKGISDERFILAGFHEVHHDILLLKEHKLVLSHAPLEVTSPGYSNVHGHIHNSSPYPRYPFYDSRNLCVSAEVINYVPISITELLSEPRRN